MQWGSAGTRETHGRGTPFLCPLYLRGCNSLTPSLPSLVPSPPSHLFSSQSLRPPEMIMYIYVFICCFCVFSHRNGISTKSRDHGSFVSSVSRQSRKVLIWKWKEPSLGDQIRFLEEMIFRVRPEGCIGVSQVFWWSGGMWGGRDYCSNMVGERAWLKSVLGRGQLRMEV